MVLLQKFFVLLEKKTPGKENNSSLHERHKHNKKNSVTYLQNKTTDYGRTHDQHRKNSQVPLIKEYSFQRITHRCESINPEET